MPSASTLRRSWLRPRKTYASGFDRIGVSAGFRPGLVFDLYDPAGNRLGWGRVTGPGDIELFDAASNRLGSVRPHSVGYAKGNGRQAKTYAPAVEALKEGEVLEIGPQGQRGVWRNIGGNPIFIAVAKGESVPKAIKRVQQEKEGGGQAAPGREAGKGSGSAVGRSADFLKAKARARDPGEAMTLAENVHRTLGTTVSLNELYETYAAPLDLEGEQVDIDYRAQSGAVTIAVNGDINGKRADIVRHFWPGPEGLEVTHELFDLPASAQGKGIAARVYKAQEDLYRRMGVRKVSMSANGTIGKYAWALHGFDFADPGERERVAFSMRAIGRSVFGVEPPDGFGRMTHAWEFATSSSGTPIRLTGELRSKILRDLPGKKSEMADLKDGDYEFGKLAMILDGSWDGIKDYGPNGNSEGAKIGMAYLSKKVKKTAEAAQVGGASGQFGQDSGTFHAELGGWPDDGAGVTAVLVLQEASPKGLIGAIIQKHPDWDRNRIKLEVRRQQKEGSR